MEKKDEKDTKRWSFIESSKENIRRKNENSKNKSSTEVDKYSKPDNLIEAEPVINKKSY